MPPYNDEEGHEEVDDEVIGCSEIEVVEDGAIQIGPAIPFCASSSHYSSLAETSYHSLVDVLEEEEMANEEEGIEVSSDLMTFLDTLLGYSCVGCEPCASEGSCVNRPPGILKRSSYAATYKPLSAQPMMNKRTVSFSQLDIKEFKMSLGDHPCSSSGPPVMLDWDARPTLERVVSLDEYERMRSPRRSRNKLKLSYRDRKGILEQGFTTEEVNRAWAEAIKIRQQRHETLRRGTLLNAWDDVYESWQRKCHRAAEAVGLG
jgi:hypothetical protein